jgi:hypothetical protein
VNIHAFFLVGTIVSGAMAGVCVFIGVVAAAFQR